jgi:hypothetical protein
MVTATSMASQPHVGFYLSKRSNVAYQYAPETKPGGARKLGSTAPALNVCDLLDLALESVPEPGLIMFSHRYASNCGRCPEHQANRNGDYQSAS